MPTPDPIHQSQPWKQKFQSFQETKKITHILNNGLPQGFVLAPNPLQCIYPVSKMFTYAYDICIIAQGKLEMVKSTPTSDPSLEQFLRNGGSGQTHPKLQEQHFTLTTKKPIRIQSDIVVYFCDERIKNEKLVINIQLKKSMHTISGTVLSTNTQWLPYLSNIILHPISKDKIVY